MTPFAIAVVVALALTPLAAQAEAAPDVARPYVAQLAAQGYDGITVGTTWLGRIVITARRDGTSREILLNRRSGALLGDSAFPTALAGEPSRRARGSDAPTPDPSSGGGADVAGGRGDLLDSGGVVEVSPDDAADRP